MKMIHDFDQFIERTGDRFQGAYRIFFFGYECADIFIYVCEFFEFVPFFVVFCDFVFDLIEIVVQGFADVRN